MDEFLRDVGAWRPTLDEISLAVLTGDMLFDAVDAKLPQRVVLTVAGTTSGVGWFDGLAAILAVVEESGTWPGHLLDAYFVMIPKEGGDGSVHWAKTIECATYRSQAMGHSPTVPYQDWFESWLPKSVFSAGRGRSSVDAWYATALDIEECPGSEEDAHFHTFVADVVKSFDTVDKNILDFVLSRLGLPGWFRHVHFKFHAKVGLRFKCAAGVVGAWTRDGGISQGCPLSMVFTAALYLPSFGGYRWY